MPATVVVTLDYYKEALTSALPIMKARQLPATFYVAVTSGVVDLIDHPSGNYPTSLELADAQQNGWEIGIYSNTAMTSMLGATGTPLNGTPTNALAVKQFMLTQKSKLLAKGFDAKSFAPNGRAWNAPLADLSRDVFENVRVALGGAWQPYPIPDKNYVVQGGTASIGQNDTAASLTAQLDAVKAAGNAAWFIVAHKVGPVADPYTILDSEFAGFMDVLVAERTAGNIRVVTFSQAMQEP